MADTAVIRGQDDAHAVFFRCPFRKTERRHDLRHQFVGQPDIGPRISDLGRGDVELTRHRRHDLHQAAGPAARGDVGREARFVVGDGAHQAPVVALLFADVANQIVVGRNDVTALGEQRVVHLGQCVQCVVRRGCAELGVEAVKCRKNG